MADHVQGFPNPPSYYKKFAEGPDALPPPRVLDISRHNETYTLFGVAKRFDMEEHSLRHLAETNPLYAGVTELEHEEPEETGDRKGVL